MTLPGGATATGATGGGTTTQGGGTGTTGGSGTTTQGGGTGTTGGSATTGTGGTGMTGGGAGTTQPPAISTDDGTPQPALPLAADSVVKQAVLCTGVDAQNNPTGAASQFPAETKKVGLFLDFAGAPANTEISLEWYRGGKMVLRRLLLVSGDKQVITFVYPERRPYLRVGNYAVEILQNDRLVGRLRFAVQ